MITCQDARNLFDRYIEGDLPSSLQTELQAHRLNCPSCQNELVMLETLGDVISLDHHAPKLDDSFTDRVLSARREQLKAAKPRRWNRLMLYTAPPLAAAACITFFLFMTTPWSKTHETVISGQAEKVPRVAVKLMTGPNGSPTTPEEQADLDATEEMAPPVFAEAIAKLLQKTHTTLEDTRRGVKDLELLLYLSLSDTIPNDQLIEEWQTLHLNDDTGVPSVFDSTHDPDQKDPASPNTETSTESDTERDWNDAL